MFTKEQLGQYADEELDALVSQVREIKKERKEEAKRREKEERKRLAQENLDRLAEMDEGEEVSFLYKGEEATAPLVRVTDKRFIVDIDGEGTKRAIMPDKLVG
jgi:acetyl-CoA carboxylase carboxyltransferase component